MITNNYGDRYTLPFNPQTGDITCYRVLRDENAGRNATHLCFNIGRRHIHHSPSGFEWGYLGSGPADYALNILALWLPQRLAPLKEDDFASVELWDKTRVSYRAWQLHQPFKQHFIATLAEEGGTIRGTEIYDWLKDKGVADTEMAFPQFPQREETSA
jgi:hypothetical protein